MLSCLNSAIIEDWYLRPVSQYYSCFLFGNNWLNHLKEYGIAIILINKICAKRKETRPSTFLTLIIIPLDKEEVDFSHTYDPSFLHAHH